MNGLAFVRHGQRATLLGRTCISFIRPPHAVGGFGSRTSSQMKWYGHQHTRRISSGRGLRKDSGGGDKGKGKTNGNGSAAEISGESVSVTAAEKAQAQQSNTHTLYGDIESRILARFSTERSDRFRLYVSATLVGTILIAVLYGPEMKSTFGKKAVEVAQETLENEKLKQQTSDLAMAVVQTLLNDKQVAANASNFLREACSVKETKDALLSLTMSVLQHPDSVKEVGALLTKVIADLAEDPETIKNLGTLLGAALAENSVSDTIGELIGKSRKCRSKIDDLRVYISILLIFCFMWSGVLNSSGVLLS